MSSQCDHNMRSIGSTSTDELEDQKILQIPKQTQTGRKLVSSWTTFNDGCDDAQATGGLLGGERRQQRRAAAMSDGCAATAQQHGLGGTTVVYCTST